jgi:hypothetical protein
MVVSRLGQTIESVPQGLADRREDQAGTIDQKIAPLERVVVEEILESLRHGAKEKETHEGGEACGTGGFDV